MFLFFFFKQKTAYEMRISDWSSDVCSSDLRARDRRRGQRQHMDIGLQRLQPFLVGDAEFLLLVDDDQAEALERHRFGEQRMGADDNIDRSVFKPRTRLCGIA